MDACIKLYLVHISGKFIRYFYPVLSGSEGPGMFVSTAVQLLLERN